MSSRKCLISLGVEDPGPAYTSVMLAIKERVSVNFRIKQAIILAKKIFPEEFKS